MQPCPSARTGVQTEGKIDEVGAGAQSPTGCGATALSIFLEVRRGQSPKNYLCTGWKPYSRDYRLGSRLYDR